MTSIVSVIYDIQQERKRQTDKWGEQNHELPYWLAILGEEFGEVSKEIVERPNERTEDLRKELIQLAAVACP